MCSTQSSPIGVQPFACTLLRTYPVSWFTGSSRKLLSYRLSFLGYKPKASLPLPVPGQRRQQTERGSARKGKSGSADKRHFSSGGICPSQPSMGAGGTVQYRDLGWAAGRKEQARIDSCSIASVPTKSAAPDGDGNAPPPAAQRSVLDFRRVWPLPPPGLPAAVDGRTSASLLIGKCSCRYGACSYAVPFVVAVVRSELRQ